MGPQPRSLTLRRQPERCRAALWVHDPPLPRAVPAVVTPPWWPSWKGSRTQQATKPAGLSRPPRSKPLLHRRSSVRKAPAGAIESSRSPPKPDKPISDSLSPAPSRGTNRSWFFISTNERLSCPGACLNKPIRQGRRDHRVFKRHHSELSRRDRQGTWPMRRVLGIHNSEETGDASEKGFSEVQAGAKGGRRRIPRGLLTYFRFLKSISRLLSWGFLARGTGVLASFSWGNLGAGFLDWQPGDLVKRTDAGVCLNFPSQEFIFEETEVLQLWFWDIIEGRGEATQNREQYSSPPNRAALGCSWSIKRNSL